MKKTLSPTEQNYFLGKRLQELSEREHQIFADSGFIEVTYLMHTSADYNKLVELEEAGAVIPVKSIYKDAPVDAVIRNLKKNRTIIKGELYDISFDLVVSQN